MVLYCINAQFFVTLYYEHKYYNYDREVYHGWHYACACCR